MKITKPTNYVERAFSFQIDFRSTVVACTFRSCKLDFYLGANENYIAPTLPKFYKFHFNIICYHY